MAKKNKTIFYFIFKGLEIREEKRTKTKKKKKSVWGKKSDRKKMNR